MSASGSRETWRPGEEPGRSIPVMLDDLMRLRWRVRYWLAGVLAGGITLMHHVSRGWQDITLATALIGVVMLMAIVQMVIFMRRRHEQLLLPQLAQAYGLHMIPDDDGALTWVPPEVMPLGIAGRRIGASLSGEIEGRALRMAELFLLFRRYALPGPAREAVEFAGLVLSRQGGADWPEMMLVSQSHLSVPLRACGFITPEGFTAAGTLASGTHGIWLRDPGDKARLPADAVLQGLIDQAATFPMPSAGLIALHAASGRVILTVEARRQVMTLRGLLAGRDRLRAEVARTARQIEAMLSLVARIPE